jgi:hypothetical protein
MENFRDKMREMFSTPNKTNSGRKAPKKSTQVPFWSVLEWFVGYRVGCNCLQVWNTSVCCKVCNRQEQEKRVEEQ